MMGDGKGRWEVRAGGSHQEFLRYAAEHLPVAFGRLAILGREVDFEAGGFEGVVGDAGFGWVVAIV
jgi:hypothetical protein